MSTEGRPVSGSGIAGGLPRQEQDTSSTRVAGRHHRVIRRARGAVGGRVGSSSVGPSAPVPGLDLLADGPRELASEEDDDDVDRDELLEIFSNVESEPGRFVEQLARSCSLALGVAGCGVALILEAEHRGSLGASSPPATRGEDLQYLLGEGPAFDAARTRGLVAVADLAVRHTPRWPVFAAAAAAEGIHAVFAAPLAVGAASLGALTVYEPRPGALTPEQCDDLIALGEILSHLVLSLQAGADAGTLAAALADVGSYHPEIHQATGMVAARLGVPVAHAMVVLRARAYADGIPLAALARDVVARRIQFDHE